jgi:hypothetical protein
MSVKVIKMKKHTITKEDVSRPFAAEGDVHMGS